jgi:hypothetical protein
MGKIPTSAFLHLYQRSDEGPGSLSQLVDEVCRRTPDPTTRADQVVSVIDSIYRIGRKLATMYVSSLSVPALAPGLAPWHPRLDGAHLVVVDTNVARAIDTLRRGRGSRSYQARARWLQRTSARIDLRRYRPELPAYSPRLVQQAVFLYRSAANRADRADDCGKGRPCSDCVVAVCPFR